MKIIEKYYHKPEKQSVSPHVKQVYIELSTHCNLSCRSCIRQSIIGFRKSHFTPQLMRKLSPMLEAANLERIVLLGFGEALCNPHINELLAKLRKIDTRIVLVSNASFLTEEMSLYLVSLPLDELYVSWDDEIYGDDMNIRRGASAEVFRNNMETLAGKKAVYGSNRPLIGMQIVATRSNYQFINGSIEYGSSIGIEKFIVSNLYPYSKTMAGEILYDDYSLKKIKLHKLLRREIKRHQVKVANQDIYVNRTCPFIEKGTLFITAEGDITTCPELAYTHPAFYSGMQRIHNRYILCNINTDTLEGIWSNKAFEELRNNFLYYDFPDCSFCQHPNLCNLRTERGYDCYDNSTPCGECLWARGIVVCP
jgi:MoaA/NifB/PqqE/SkfB family radical SAM enzyme